MFIFAKCMSIRRIAISLSLLLLLPASVMAKADTTALKKLEAEMYRLFTTLESDSFIAVTDQLKEQALEARDQRLFYKAWCNQAIYYSRGQSRKKALETVAAVRDYAVQHDSKYGLFSSSSTSASILSGMRMYEQAEVLYRRAIEYLHRYFPDESAAVCYLGLAKLYFNQHKYKETVECADQALREPGVIPTHQLNALSYKCLSAYNTNGSKEFIRIYDEREKLREKLGGVIGPLERILKVYLAECQRDYPKMLSLALAQPKGVDRLSLIARAYALCGDYKSAYETYKEYKTYSDSVNTDEIRRESSENALNVDIARAELEAKDLRLANQRMWMIGGIVITVLTLMFLLFYHIYRKKQLRKLKDAYDRLEDTTTAKERIESELRIAHDIQMSMVPSIFPPYPERNDIDLFASMKPAKEVAGDLYDFFLQGDKLYFCVGDVSGKGVPASMTMAVVVNLFRSFAKEGFPPEYVATKLNDVLASDNRNGLFVTLFIGIADLKSGSLDFCNAGHNPPVIIDVQHPSFMEVESNVPVGLWENYEFVGERIDNIHGKVLLVYTDGVTEAENSRQEQYGEGRMMEALKWHRFESARQTVELLQAEVSHHVGNAEPSDDMTLLCLKIS